MKLSDVFNKHNLHYVHYAMMAGMAVAAVAAMPATAAAATIPDVGFAFLDSGWSMLEGLGETFDVVSGVWENTISGDFSLNYEWGTMDHSGVAHDVMAHGATDPAVSALGHGTHVMPEPTMGGVDLSAHFHGGADLAAHAHGEAACSVQDMIDWQNSETLLPEIDAEIAGGTYASRADYFMEFCHEH